MKLNEERYEEMARTVNRDRKVMMNLVKDLDNYGKRKSKLTTTLGIKLSITSCSWNKRAIQRTASNSSSIERQIAEKAGLTTSMRNVRRLLKNCEHLKR